MNFFSPFIVCSLLCIIYITQYTVAKSVSSKSVADDNDELVSVAVLYRHGDRGPISSYPNDPYVNKSYWPDGLGQLLNKGKMRQFELGQWLRKRYDNFLSENYTPDEIKVITTDVDRCHMSAQANLAGLYRPTGDSIWNKDLLWEPIPVHSSQGADDAILAMDKSCPKFDELYAKLADLDYFKNLLVENQDMVDYISEKTNWDVTLDHIRTLHSVFYVYENHNSSYIPDWAANIEPKNFSYLASVGYIKKTFTHDLKRLHAGPFFNYLISHFEGVLESKLPKFLMLSAHDTTVGSILNGMNAYDFVSPEFTSTIIWELRRNKNGEAYINMFYKKPSLSNIKEVTLDGCDFNCEFVDFKMVLSTIAIDEESWNTECNS